MNELIQPAKKAQKDFWADVSYPALLSPFFSANIFLKFS